MCTKTQIKADNWLAEWSRRRGRHAAQAARRGSGSGQLRNAAADSQATTGRSTAKAAASYSEIHFFHVFIQLILMQLLKCMNQPRPFVCSWNSQLLKI